MNSTNPGKQRVFRREAPLHVKSRMVSSHLSSELRDKHSKRSITVRVGDKVKVLRGSNKGREGLITNVDLKKMKVQVEALVVKKKDGSEVLIDFDPSNLLVVSLKLDDKRRIKSGDK